ncbi:hypothetical protein [Micromonospora sp. WMMD1219]|uniref:hypothetical protein n=1 Tax=Micromonospora sp. WMMD1219 TaxID=3404115 RepID=UPI003BF4F24D
MTDQSWFELCKGRALMQGDLLPQCGVLKWQDEGVDPDEMEGTIVATDVVILTQSCDLEHDGKVEFVLLAELLNYDELVRVNPAKYGKKDFRSQCSRGRYPNLALLPPFVGPPTLSWTIVDFSHLYTLPKPVVENHAEAMGTRLRLRSPYREHISQGFARYFMRVGLPAGLEAFDKYTPATA